MLRTAIVEEIRLLLASGRISQRGIARRLGISRGTVSAVAQGQRRERTVGPQGTCEDPEARGPLERCPGCGARVFMPCLACRIRAIQRRRSA